MIATARRLSLLRSFLSPRCGPARADPSTRGGQSVQCRTVASSPSQKPQPQPPRAAIIAADASSGRPHEDGMERWPGLGSARRQLRAMDYVGTLSFASSGAIAAATAQMDLLGALFVGTVTAVGGGTIRDAVVLSKRPFWTEETEYLYMSLAAAGVTFALWPHDEDKKPVDHAALNWVDALGVGAFAVIGAQNAIRAQMPVVVTLLCGVSTATFGGVTRDLLTARPVRILHSHAELYASTAAAGAAAYVITKALRAPVPVRILTGVGTSMFARYCSWTYGLRLPTWEKADATSESTT